MEPVKHEGIVEKVSGSNITVRITSQPACAGCSARVACMLSDSAEKLIDLHTNFAVTQGQRVMIVENQQQGFKATWLAYLFPAVVVIAVLAVTVLVTGSESMAAILSIAALIPYFMILRKLNSRWKKTFSLKIEPINE